jgi:hypothetical protein
VVTNSQARELLRLNPVHSSVISGSSVQFYIYCGQAHCHTVDLLDTVDTPAAYGRQSGMAW